MNKLQKAAKALNEKALSVPTGGRTVKAPELNLGVYQLSRADMGREYQPNVLRVFNITAHGRHGKTIGFLRLNSQGLWA